MNPFDIFIIVILVFCLIRGIFRGIVKEISSIVGVLGGFYAAYTYYPIVGDLIASWITNRAYLNVVSFTLIFVCVLIAISILGVIIKYLMNIAFLGWIDRVSGAVFALIKGILIVCVMFIALTAFLPKGSPVISNSVLSPYVALVSETMAKLVSKDMKKQFVYKMNELKKVWKSK